MTMGMARPGTTGRMAATPDYLDGDDGNDTIYGGAETDHLVGMLDGGRGRRGELPIGAQHMGRELLGI